MQNFAEIALNLPFHEFYIDELYRLSFEKSGLGIIKRVLPSREMSENFGLASKSLNPILGRKSLFTLEGKVALMFLKTCTGPNCPRLMEKLNGNIQS